jgi:hypothetical protein
MTAVDERSPAIGLVPDHAETVTSSPQNMPSTGHVVRDTPSSAVSSGESEVRTLKVARFAATVIMALIAAACFVLSFSSLWDLASRSVSWPRHLAWLLQQARFIATRKLSEIVC